MTKTWIHLMVAACLLTACTGDPDGDFENDYQTLPSDAIDKALLETQYLGIWSIDGQEEVLQEGVTAETPDMQNHTNGTQSTSNPGSSDIDYHYDGTFEASPRITFHRFPMEGIVRHLLPELNSFYIIHGMRIGTKLTLEESLLLETIANHGDNNYCMALSLSLPLKAIGYSGQTLYCELGGNYRYFPFVVKKTDGSYFALVLDIDRDASPFVIKPESLNAQFTVSRFEIIDSDGKMTVNELQPAMVIKYTSTRKR